MDLAILSAQAAAQTLIAAWQKSDFGRSSLAGYEAALKEKSLRSLLPVSYTHLDVYKRQVNKFSESLVR